MRVHLAAAHSPPKYVSLHFAYRGNCKDFNGRRVQPSLWHQVFQCQKSGLRSLPDITRLVFDSQISGSATKEIQHSAREYQVRGEIHRRAKSDRFRQSSSTVCESPLSASQWSQANVSSLVLGEDFGSHLALHSVPAEYFEKPRFPRP